MLKEIIINKKEYFELVKAKSIIEEILNSLEEKKIDSEDNFSKAFGVFRNDIKGDSLGYVSKLRKEWRK